MQINQDNVFDAWERLDKSGLSADLIKSHRILENMVAKRGWSFVKDGAADYLKEHLLAVQTAWDKQHPDVPGGADGGKARPAKSRKDAPAKEQSAAKAGRKRQTAKPAPKSADVHLVRDLDVELQLMRRFVGLHGKPRTRKQVLALLSALNRAITKGHIRKTDNPTRFHADMVYIQKRLVDALGNHLKKAKDGEAVILEFDEKEIKRMEGLVESFGVYPSVRLALRFFGMEGKSPKIDKARTLLDQVRKVVSSGKVGPDDPAFKLINRMEAALADYVAGGSSILRIEGATLQGLAGVVLGCPCQHGRGAKAQRR
jgi:hypothetical protein